MDNEQEYTNDGKGVVLENRSITETVRNLFMKQAEWTSAELNDKVGWQFSQAVHFCRKNHNMNIKTYAIGGHKYMYKLEAGEYHPPIRTVTPEKLKTLRELANDSWNVDDTVCQQNMAKIRELLA